MNTPLQISSDNGGLLGATSLLAVNIPAASGGGGPTTLLKDTFTDSDGTSLSSHAMDVGPGWTLNGTWSIQGDRAEPASVDNQLAWADSGQTNITITVDVLARSFPGIAARLSDANNFWLCRLNVTGNSLDIFSCVSGTYTQVASTGFSIVQGNSYTLEVVVSGSSISLTVNATTVSYNSMSTNLTATRCGFRNGYSGGSIATYDNFLVTT